MLVIGDAAHAVSPATGQGASLAIEDAVVLARCLAAPAAGSDPRAAFDAYEAERRERVERVVAYGKRLGSTKTAGPVGRRIRDAVLPRFLAMAASPKAMAKQAWIFDYRAELS
jgi:2-polyprenyl-6-methoxyphenol hydroxylase-like FAD-dependent oxidoreductase